MGELLTMGTSALGGIGIFILAIGMMTDGLKAAAGQELRHLLSNWTQSPFKGIATGFLMTAVVQSSSAVTVASLGFVNAGLMSMHQVLGVIFGANVGTTMTGWLVALLGFKVDIQSFALPLIGIGMIMKLVRQRGRLASLGYALVGFGLFFLGLDILKTSFDTFTGAFTLDQLHANGMWGLVLYLFVGIVMTILTQSSSASIAITITAASTGVIELYAAGAMVIGANIGTTSTAVFAALGATPAAKRAAAAQVIFNLCTALIAVMLLPVLFWLIRQFSEATGLSSDVAISLALFHTLFNVLGLILMTPNIGRLATWLDTRFRSETERESRPRYLDNTIAQMPSLAVNALLNELNALQPRILAVFQKSTQRGSVEHDKTFYTQVSAIKALSEKIATFIVNLESAPLPQETTEQLATLMRVENYLQDCTSRAETLAAAWSSRHVLRNDNLEQQIQQFLKDALSSMHSMSNGHTENTDADGVTMEQLEQQREQLKTALIFAGTQRDVDIGQMSSAIECLEDAWHIVKTWQKAARRLTALTAVLVPRKDATEEVTPSAASS